MPFEKYHCCQILKTYISGQSSGNDLILIVSHAVIWKKIRTFEEASVTKIQEKNNYGQIT